MLIFKVAMQSWLISIYSTHDMYNDTLQCEFIRSHVTRQNFSSDHIQKCDFLPPVHQNSSLTIHFHLSPLLDYQLCSLQFGLHMALIKGRFIFTVIFPLPFWLKTGCPSSRLSVPNISCEGLDVNEVCLNLQEKVLPVMASNAHCQDPDNYSVCAHTKLLGGMNKINHHIHNINFLKV